MQLFKAIIIPAALFFALLVSLPVQAQEVTELESITVTANKMEEDVQDVSASTTVFSTKNIEDLRIESISDVAAFTPNFMVYENGVSGANAPSMRGLYADIHSHSVSVGMYVDGVPVLNGMAYEQELLDIERIEVLKGPQGTLYGKSTEAGVVNIITRQPGNTFSGNISGEAGIDQKQKIAVALSGPIKKDKFYFGISALRDQKDGWVERVNSDNTVDDIERWYGSAKLRYTPLENLDITLKGTILKYDDGQPHLNLSPMGAAMYGLASPEDRKTDPSFQGHNKMKTFSESLMVDWHITENLKLTSITAYRKTDFDARGDYDFNQPTLLHFFNNNSLSKLSEEFRISSSGTSIKWVAGLYGDKDEFASDYSIDSSIPGMAMNVDDDKLEGKSGSAFAHVSVPAGEKLTIMGGLRYDYQEKEFKSPGYAISIDDEWSEISPKIGFEYRISPAIMTYVTVSKGYLSGGFNPYAHDADYLSYDEEKLWSYEIGVKNTFYNNRLILNSAVFYMDIDDVQVHQLIDSARSYTTNAAKATSKGVELELAAIPVRGLTITAGFGYSDVEFDEFKDTAGDYKGNKKPYAPEYTFNLGAQYRSITGFYCRADMTGYGEMYTDKANTYKRDAYELVNAKIGYEANNFDVYLYGKNVFDKKYDSTYGDGFYTNYSKPAEAGVAMTYRF